MPEHRTPDSLTLKILSLVDDSSEYGTTTCDLATAIGILVTELRAELALLATLGLIERDRDGGLVLTGDGRHILESLRAAAKVGGSARAEIRTARLKRWSENQRRAATNQIMLRRDLAAHGIAPEDAGLPRVVERDLAPEEPLDFDLTDVGEDE